MSIKGREIKKVGITTFVTFACVTALSTMNTNNVHAAEQGTANQVETHKVVTTQSQDTNKISNDTQNLGESYLDQRIAEIERRHQKTDQVIKEDSNSAIYNDSNELSDGKTVGEKVRELNDNNALGMAAEFHIFSKDKVDLSSGVHTEGNIATKTIDARVDFGPRDLGKKNHTEEGIHYVRNIENLSANAFDYYNLNSKSHVIFQGDFDVPQQSGRAIVKTNGREYTLDKIGTDHSVVTVLSDKDMPYIDLDQEFLHLGTKSNEWSKKGTSEKVGFIESDDEVNKHPEIDVSDAVPDDNNFIYVNLDADKLHNTKTVDTLRIKGLGKKKNGDLPTIIINVNLKDKTSFKVSSEIKLDYVADDGTTKEFSGGSEHHYFYNQIIWNFGTHLQNLDLTNTFLGSVLAPDANIIADGNSHVDGNIIGKEVTIKSESHRWDLASHTNRKIPNFGFFIVRPPKDPKKEEPKDPKKEEPKDPKKEEPKDPKKEEPKDPKKEEPKDPKKEEPKDPKKEEPKDPKKEEPKDPKKEEPKDPKKEEPKDPKKEEPKDPKKEEPKDPKKEEPKDPKKEEPTNPNTPPNIPENFIREKRKTYTYSFAHTHGQDYKEESKKKWDKMDEEKFSYTHKTPYTRTVRDKADNLQHVVKNATKITRMTDTKEVVSNESASELPETGANESWMASLIGFATFALGALGLKLNKKNR